MVDRILSLMKEKNLTPSQFADEIGIQRSGISHLISGRNKPSLEFMMKVLQRFPDVSPEYLLYGSAGNHESENAPKPVRSEIEPVIPGTLFDQPPVAETKPEPRPLRQMTKKDRAEKRIEKIVVLYDDKTFREYEPE